MNDIAFVDSARAPVAAPAADAKPDAKPEVKAEASSKPAARAKSSPPGDAGKAPTSGAPSDVETLARKLGWKPEGDWKGDKTTWTPASEFLTSKIKAGERTSKDVKKLSAKVQEFGSLTSAALARQRATLTAEFESRQEALIKKGDVAGVRALAKEHSAEMETLKTPVLDEDADEDDELEQAEQYADAILNDPLASAFFGEHDWILDEENSKTHDWCEEYGAVLLKKGKTPYEMFKELGAILRERNPKHYAKGKPKEEPSSRGRAPYMNMPSRGAGGEQAIWGRRVPIEYREIAQAEVKDGLFKSIDEWARSYLESKGETL